MKKKQGSILFIFACLFGHIVSAQINLGKDTSICDGDSIVFSVSGPYVKYLWNDGSTGTTLKVKKNGTYSVTGYDYDPLTNLVVNGNFQGGNSSFTSAYNYNTVNIYTAGDYQVTDNAAKAHKDFTSCPDHSGTGNMMVANGTSTLNQKLWCQNVSVYPNTNYTMGVWLSSATSTYPAIMQFTFNGVAPGTSFKATPTVCSWNNFKQNWNSGVSTSVEICIINKNNSLDGNDFMLDDVSFTRKDTVKVLDTVKVALNAKPIFDLGTDKNICAATAATLDAGPSFSYYSWSNNTKGSTASSISVSTSGNYAVEVTSNKGCKNSDSINVTFSNKLNVDLGKDTILCFGQNITLNAGAGLSTYLWSTGENTATKTVSTAGTYTVNVTNSSNCSGSGSINIAIDPAINLAFSAATASICSGASVVLSPTLSGGTNPFSYQWTGPKTALSSSITTTIAGSYNAIFTDSKGCSASATIDVKTQTLPNVALIPNSMSMCTGENKKIGYDCGADYNYQWSPITNTAPTFNPTTSDAYKVIVSNTQTTCKDSVVINVIVHPKPQVDLLNSIAPCEGTSTLISAGITSIDLNYAWTKKSFGAALQGNTSSLLINSSDLYTLTATNTDNCSSSDSLLATFKKKPSLSLLGGIDTFILCSGNKQILDAGNTSPGYSFLWNNNSKTNKITVSAGGTYIVKVSNGSCASSDTIVASEISLPQQVLQAQNLPSNFCFNEHNALQLRSGISDPQLKLRWSTGDTSTNILAQNPGTYTLLISQKNCSSSDSITIFNYCENSFFVPNCFTPNNDSHNDIFYPYARNIEDYELLVFNRWGEIIFKSNNQTIGWDGSYNGQAAQEDVYVYKVLYSVDLENGKKSKKEQIGHVLLLR